MHMGRYVKKMKIDIKEQPKKKKKKKRTSYKTKTGKYATAQERIMPPMYKPKAEKPKKDEKPKPKKDEKPKEDKK